MICPKCKQRFKNYECFYDESGYGYYTKMTRCPECEYKIIIKNIDDYSTILLNKYKGLDPRYYMYNEKE